MNGIISSILSVAFVGVVVLLCLFSCFLASKSDEYWKQFKKELEDKNDRR